jgi:hypothetical protein
MERANVAFQQNVPEECASRMWSHDIVFPSPVSFTPCQSGMASWGLAAHPWGGAEGQIFAASRQD